MPELLVENLHIRYPSRTGWQSVVNGVSFQLGTERLGIVGESGSGKSMTAKALMGLVPSPGQVSANRLTLDGTDLLSLSPKAWRAWRGRQISMVMQDPKHALNPVQKVGVQIAEAGLLHGALTRSQARMQVLSLLQSVGVQDPERVADCYPHQLSGGLGQRVMIAAMLMASPTVLIADEPTSALDAMVRSQVLDVMDAEIRRRGMGLLLISHDLGMVARYCDRVLIMYRGQIVEECVASQLHQARHPYTRGLLACQPSAARRGQLLPVLDRSQLPEAMSA